MQGRANIKLVAQNRQKSAQEAEKRDGESGGHVRRIQGITRTLLIRTELGRGLSEDEVESIALAAVMHDVGKIAIPDAILTKPGPLTPEELEIMKSHTVIGAQMLEDIPQLHGSGEFPYAVDIARHHHERWDGSGYPDGLSGDELAAALDAGDVAAARRAAHALRGVSVNLSLAPLADAAARMLELLHAGDVAGARALMGEVRAARERAVAAIGAD